MKKEYNIEEYIELTKEDKVILEYLMERAESKNIDHALPSGVFLMILNPIVKGNVKKAKEILSFLKPKIDNLWRNSNEEKYTKNAAEIRSLCLLLEEFVEINRNMSDEDYKKLSPYYNFLLKIEKSGKIRKEKLKISEKDLDFLIDNKFVVEQILGETSFILITKKGLVLKKDIEKYLNKNLGLFSDTNLAYSKEISYVTTKYIKNKTI